MFYKVSDEYCNFYFKWILPIKDKLKQGKDTNYWKSVVKTPAYYNWAGHVFENICFKHLSQIQKALHIPGFSLASPWRVAAQKGEGKEGAQIDLLFERDDDAITLCEVKYTEKPFVVDKKYAKNLSNKIGVFAKITQSNKQIFLALITASGLKDTMYSEDLVNGGVVTLEDLFKD